jgi:hypothetical protein
MADRHDSVLGIDPFSKQRGLKFWRGFADTGAMLVVLVVLLAAAQAFLFAGASLWLIVAMLRYQKDPSPERKPVLKYLFSWPGFESPLRRLSHSERQ